MSQEKWLKLLKENKAYCYIKPNRHKHDSGFRCFEVGYLTIVKDKTKMKDKLVLGDYSDHIWFYDFLKENKDNKDLNMDLLIDGYIRIWSYEPLWWGSLKFVCSSARLSLIS